MAEPELSEDLRKYLESIPPFTMAELEALEKAARDLNNDPEFLACLARHIEKERELNNDSTTTS